MLWGNNIPATNAELAGSLLPTRLAEFNFEPKFPIALLTTPREMDRLRETNRLAQADVCLSMDACSIITNSICVATQVELLTTADLESQDALVKIECWLDDLGI